MDYLHAVCIGCDRARAISTAVLGAEKKNALVCLCLGYFYDIETDVEIGVDTKDM